MHKGIASIVSLLAVATLFAACEKASPESYSLGGTVSGLTGELVLQNNGGSDLTVGADGPFTFPTRLEDGASYDVSVKTQPAGQVCTLSGNTGRIARDVTTVAVSCINHYAVVGTVTGLIGSLVLQNNGGDDLTVSADGTFAFPTLVPDGSGHDVRVKTQPPHQVCTVAGGLGTVDGGDVTTVAVSCVTRFWVGGTVSGLNGPLVLQNNGGDDLTVSADGTFAFPPVLADGAPYDVTVKSQPPRATCTVAAHSGTIGGDDVSSVSVSCISYHSVGGTASGVRGTLVLQNNGGDFLTVSNDRAFTFPTLLANGTIFDVSVKSQPAGQSCAVTGNRGTLAGADVASVSVVCGETMIVGPFTAAYDDGVSVVATETVPMPSLGESSAFHGIDPYNFHAVWTGDLEVRGSSTNVDFNFELSWAEGSLTIDGASVATFSANHSVRRLLTPGIHSVRIEYTNNWHTLSFFASITTNTAFTKPEAKTIIAPLIDANTRILYVGCYESADVYADTSVTLAPTAEPVFLFLSSLTAMNWTLLNPDNVNVVGVAYATQYSAAGTVSADSIPTYEVLGLTAAYDSATRATAIADVTAIAGRAPNATSYTYSQGDVTVTAP